MTHCWLYEWMQVYARSWQKVTGYFRHLGGTTDCVTDFLLCICWLAVSCYKHLMILTVVARFYCFYLLRKTKGSAGWVVLKPDLCGDWKHGPRRVVTDWDFCGDGCDRTKLCGTAENESHVLSFAVNSISQSVTATKIRLYSAYILPVLLYGAETWTLTKVLSKKIYSFELWCQRRILRVHYSHI